MSSRSRRFLGQPKRSKLSVVIAVDPPGSVGVTTTLSVGEDTQPTEPAAPGVKTIECNRANTVYQLDVEMAWGAKGTVVIACFLEQPGGTKLERKSMVFDGTNGNVDSAHIMVVTT